MLDPRKGPVRAEWGDTITAGSDPGTGDRHVLVGSASAGGVAALAAPNLHFGGIGDHLPLRPGPVDDDHALYASHSLWRSRADFEAWTRSEVFRRARRDAGEHRGLYLGPPQPETFEVIHTA